MEVDAFLERPPFPLPVSIFCDPPANEDDTVFAGMLLLAASLNGLLAVTALPIPSVAVFLIFQCMSFKMKTLRRFRRRV